MLDLNSAKPQRERGVTPAVVNAHSKILEPDPDTISMCLYTLFPPDFVGAHPSAHIQIAFGDPSILDGHVNGAQIYSAFDLKGAAEFAAAKNAAGFNIYISPPLLHFDGVPPNRRVGGDRYLTSAFAWVDYDNAGDDARIEAILKEKQLIPTLIVTTGVIPHVRRQLFFRVNGIRDAAHQKKVNSALQRLLGSDQLVIDAVHVMRLGGTVNYPTEKKRRERGRVTELTTSRRMD
jgi:hypothetical protein